MSLELRCPPENRRRQGRGTPLRCRSLQNSKALWHRRKVAPNSEGISLAERPPCDRVACSVLERAAQPRAPFRSLRPDRALRFGACDPIAGAPLRSVRPDRTLRFGACGPIAGSVSERVRPDRVLRFGTRDPTVRSVSERAARSSVLVRATILPHIAVFP